MTSVRYDPITRKRVGFVAPQDREEQKREVAEQLRAFKRAEKALLARDQFLTFVKFTSPDPADPNDVDKSSYKDAKHHRIIARHLEEVERGEIRFLILTMPPRHGKSELVSRKLPAWYMGRHPDHNVVVATYNDDFAMDFGSDVRTIMQSPQYKQAFGEFRLKKGGTAKDRLQTTKGGLAVFVGLGGSLTGRGAHLLIIDDLVKSDEEARSQTMRDRAWNWFTKVAMTRRMGKKLVILTFTRWHSDDIIGRLTDPENTHFNKKTAERVRIIELPAIAEDDDPLGRKPGEALWPDGPDKFDLDFLEEQQRLDPIGFASLYQQRPSAADGILFRREAVRYYDHRPEGLRIYAASDHAVSVKQRRDYTVLLTVGVDAQQNIYLIDCYWRRAHADEAVEAMLDMGRMHKPLIWWAENGHISKSLGPFLRKRMLETNTYFTIREVTPAADKETRAQSIAARMAMGKVWFPKNAIWTERAVNELLSFPNGNHDDWVDAFAHIGLGLQSQFGASVGPAKPSGTPKFGTLGWVKYADELRRRADRAAERGGF